MTPLTLRTFFVTGSLGHGGVGAARATVEAALGPPGDFDADSERYQNAKIWRYGDVELHFNGDALWLIHIERFSGPGGSPRGAGSLELEPWLIDGGLTLQGLIDALEPLRLQHTVVAQPDQDRTVLSFPSGVQLVFSGTSRRDARLELIYRSA